MSNFYVPDGIQPYLQSSQLSNYSLGSTAGIRYLHYMFLKGKSVGLGFCGSGFSNHLCPILLWFQERFASQFLPLYSSDNSIDTPQFYGNKYTYKILPRQITDQV